MGLLCNIAGWTELQLTIEEFAILISACSIQNSDCSPLHCSVHEHLGHFLSLQRRLKEGRYDRHDLRMLPKGLATTSRLRFAPSLTGSTQQWRTQQLLAVRLQLSIFHTTSSIILRAAPTTAWPVCCYYRQHFLRLSFTVALFSTSNSSSRRLAHIPPSTLLFCRQALFVCLFQP